MRKDEHYHGRGLVCALILGKSCEAKKPPRISRKSALKLDGIILEIKYLHCTFEGVFEGAECSSFVRNLAHVSAKPVLIEL